MKIEETRIKEVLPAYRDIAKACVDLVEGVVKLSELNLVEEDIERINELDFEASKELMLLAGEINEFKDNSEMILSKIL